MSVKEEEALGCPNCNTGLVPIDTDDGLRYEYLRKFEVYAQALPWRGGIELWIGAAVMPSKGKFAVVDRFVWRESKDDGGDTPSPLTIDFTAAQKLMDDLWSCGLRPSEGSGSAGALKATQKHLDDMRRLVFDTEEKA